MGSKYKGERVLLLLVIRSKMLIVTTSEYLARLKYFLLCIWEMIHSVKYVLSFLLEVVVMVKKNAKENSLFPLTFHFSNILDEKNLFSWEIRGAECVNVNEACAFYLFKSARFHSASKPSTR